MIQVCDPPRQRQVRRLSAEEFCFLARGEACSFYRPRSEVLRMLTAGEVWGVCGPEGVPGAAVMVLPLDADTAAAAALRRYLGWRSVSGGSFLTPPVVSQAEGISALTASAVSRAARFARSGMVWAVLECTPQAEALLPLYLQQGLALRAMRPLDSLAPCFLLTGSCAPARAEPVWVPLEDRVHLAVLLARGYAALDCRPTPQGLALALYPV